jgi:hypothetical protein
MNLNILYNTVVAGALLAMLAAEGVKSLCAVFGLTIKGKWALLTFLIVVALMTWPSWQPVPPAGDPLIGNKLYYLIHTIANLLAAIGVYNFVRRFFNAIEGMRNQTATKK